jgi:putative ABC transport system substrate-binding protein
MSDLSPLSRVKRKSDLGADTSGFDPGTDIRPLGPALKIAYARIESIGARLAMKRREFITLIAGGAAALPFTAHAQQPAPGKWRIGMLAPETRQKPIRQGLRDLGYSEGQNLLVEWRFDDRTDRLAALATELVRLKPDVVVANGTQAARAAQQATKSIPIVMVASNPVGDGLVESLAHPGGNITGMSLLTPELSGKRLELLRQACGRLSAITVLYNPDDPPAVSALKETLDAARQAGLQVTSVEARTPNDIASGFEKIAAARPDALVILNSPLMTVQENRNSELALQLKLPAIYTDPLFAKAGGLMAYGPNRDSILKKLATYIDKIFKGAKPADLPVEQPTKFDLIINLKTAKTLGLNIPVNLLALADEVIE